MTPLSSAPLAPAFLAEARRQLAAAHDRIRHCLGQLDDARLWWRPRDDMNSAANLVLHVCGNLRQWIVAGVGGAPDVRRRPQEFAERGPIPRDELLRLLADVVRESDAALAAAERRLLEPRRVQGFQETGLSAIFSSLVHLGGHAQEIVHLTRCQLGPAYRFAWVPASPEQGGEQPAARETVAARDAVFESGDLASLVPAAPPPAPEPVQPAESPLRDPLRELQQEFQDQQDEGKL